MVSSDNREKQSSRGKPLRGEIIASGGAGQQKAFRDVAVSFFSMKYTAQWCLFPSKSRPVSRLCDTKARSSSAISTGFPPSQTSYEAIGARTESSEGSMNESRRWGIALAAILVQMALGAVYAWSVFRVPLSKLFHSTISEVTLAFTIAIFVVGFASFFGGLWLGMVGPRIVVLTGGLFTAVASSWPAFRRDCPGFISPMESSAESAWALVTSFRSLCS